MKTIIIFFILLIISIKFDRYSKKRNKNKKQEFEEEFEEENKQCIKIQQSGFHLFVPVNNIIKGIELNINLLKNTNIKVFINSLRCINKRKYEIEFPKFTSMKTKNICKFRIINSVYFEAKPNDEIIIDFSNGYTETIYVVE